ncbi:BhlA/UviB family holin-like peptide [Clostridium tepidum]
MENIFTIIANQSPMLGLMLVFWFYQRKDYKEFVDKVQEENRQREIDYQETIKNLNLNLNKVDNIEVDVKDIKEKLK